MEKVSRKQRKRAATTASTMTTTTTPRGEWAAVGWVRGHARAVAIGLVALATMRIAATYPVYNHTADELVHVACGMEWLSQGVYRYEPQHPPLARVAAALGPYLAGLRSQGKKDFYVEGASILHHDGKYERNLTLARLGILPFFWIAAAVVFVWAKRALGNLEAAVAVFLFTFLPPVLAHSGVATTDMALAAFVGASFVAARIWVEQPSAAHSLLFGAATGLAVLSKLSALPFVPSALAAALIAYLALERPGPAALWEAARRRALPFAIAVATGAFVIWTGYRFSWDHGPAPELFAGYRQVTEHMRYGHPAYLLGMRSRYGWWYYYPVILMFKTPLAYLALLGTGAFVYLRKPRSAPRGVWLPLAFALGILLFSFSSPINIGVRHVLPVYLGFSVVAAAGVAWLLEQSRRSGWAAPVLGVLMVWMAGTSLASHPDYLPYFNALAGDAPEKIAVDSDLDWGQDMKRLGQRLRELGATHVTFSPYVKAILEGPKGFGFPPIQPSKPDAPAPGWNAVSLMVLKATRMGLFDREPEFVPWPDRVKPTEKIGKGIWLYYFPEQ